MRKIYYPDPEPMPGWGKRVATIVWSIAAVCAMCTVVYLIWSGLVELLP